MSAHKFVVFFKDIDKDDISSVGGKGANLGEMYRMGFPVPNGFAVTVEAYDFFLAENQFKKIIADILKATNIHNPDELLLVSRKIQKLISNGKIPTEVAQEVIKAYKKLSKFLKLARVAARSSATAEDLPTASFAGQQASFLNIKGEANLLNSVRNCWASLFTPRAIFYREENKIPHDKVKISVIVQKMVQSDVSGVAFSIDPVSNEKDKIVIEAVWGLGEMIVQGTVIPDRYVVQKETYNILSREISEQTIQLKMTGDTTRQVTVPMKSRQKQKLEDDEIIYLAKIADRLQKHYYFPQDLEWAKEGPKIFVVQTRPVTTFKKVERKEGEGQELAVAQAPILEGTPASPGFATGPVKVLKSAKEISKIRKGDILVAPMTSPDFVPAMKKALAIVTDEGGATSHAAIVSRELGIPCVVGTKIATKTLIEGMHVSVDGSEGQIFLATEIIERKSETSIEDVEIKIKTATKVYVNLGEPQRAKEIAGMNVDGVGLLRAEFMIANIGLHPKEAIKTKKQNHFINKLADDITTFCKAFKPRPVIYRATDFKTNEYRQLIGGKYWEPQEPNPMLGFRGAYRYITNPEVFTLELKAIKQVREKYKNLWLMIPFVRSPSELTKVRRLVAAEGLFEETTFKFWMMVELPVNVILIEDFIKVGIDGVSIGSNDLTMLIEGTDRDNVEVSQAYDERSPAVKWAIRKVIKACSKYGISSSICGQAPSTYEDLVNYLVRLGITSISVNPDAINRVRNVILEAEKKLAL